VPPRARAGARLTRLKNKVKAKPKNRENSDRRDINGKIPKNLNNGTTISLTIVSRTYALSKNMMYAPRRNGIKNYFFDELKR
jgi:hypothetical protein